MPEEGDFVASNNDAAEVEEEGLEVERLKRSSTEP